MKDTIRNHYFYILKLAGLLILLAYNTMAADDGIMTKVFHILLTAMFLFDAVMLEMAETKKIKIIYLIVEGTLAISGVLLFPVIGELFIIIFIPDLVVTLQLNPLWGLSTYGTIFLTIQNNADVGISVGIITFILICYWQEKILVASYRKMVEENEETESSLKTDILRQSADYQAELKRSRLQYENQRLEERNQISQALHDKLGHSINGSIYQLEAVKLLIDKKPEEAQNMVHQVISQMRLSMDEIRLILRKEKPDKKRMAELSLQALCEECEEQYQIHTELNVEDSEGKIPEPIWEIILDITFEAVTNALKYAKCNHISIAIVSMSEVVRCTIRDDGIGAAHVKEGMGISGMKKRVRSVKGFMDIESEAGFTINMVLPIKY